MGKRIDLDRLKEYQTLTNGTIATVESSATASKAYAVGDRFYFNGKLYICTVGIASGGTITPNTNCKLDVLGDDVSDLKTQISDVESLTEFSEIHFSATDGGYISSKNGNIVSEQGYSYTDYIDITKYSKIRYKKIGLNVPTVVERGIAFYDSSKTFISGVRGANNQATNGYTDYVVVSIPKSAVYVRLSLFSSIETYGEFDLYGTLVLVEAVANSSYKIYRESTTTNAMLLNYFADSNDNFGIKQSINELYFKIIHPSGATSSSASGVGVLINTQYTDDTNSNAFLNTNLFAQSHAAAHKMELDFHIYTIPYKILGTIDYYCDDAFVKRYDLSVVTTKEIKGILCVGGYFNTGTDTSKTYVATGKAITYPNNTIVVT